MIAIKVSVAAEGAVIGTKRKSLITRKLTVWARPVKS